MNIIRIAVIFVALLSFGFESAAESTAPLTAKSIKGFLDSLDDVEKLSEKYGDKEKPMKQQKRAMSAAEAQQQYSSMADIAAMAPTQEQMKRAASPLTSSLPEIRASEGLDEMLATVKKHGFSSIEEWASVGDRSFRAYAATKMEAEMPKMNQQMQEARESLKASGMSAKQQEAMLKMMSGGSELMQAYEDAPAADKKAIKPFLKDIEALERR